MIVREAITRFEVEVLGYLARDTDVPVVTRAACQGDVSILRITTPLATTPIPSAGVTVVRGELGGNTHSLHGEGTVFYDPAESRGGSLTVGVLTVAEGATAVMAHPEHGFLQIAPSTYRIGRQREYSGEWRMVAD